MHRWTDPHPENQVTGRTSKKAHLIAQNKSDQVTDLQFLSHKGIFQSKPNTLLRMQANRRAANDSGRGHEHEGRGSAKDTNQGTSPLPPKKRSSNPNRIQTKHHRMSYFRCKQTGGRPRTRGKGECKIPRNPSPHTDLNTSGLVAWIETGKTGSNCFGCQYTLSMQGGHRNRCEV